MAAPTLARIICLHRLPDNLSKSGPLILEFLRRAEMSRQMPIEIGGGSDLCHHLGRPFLGNVTIGASRTNARSVLEVDGLLQLDKVVVAHFMAGDAKPFV